MLTVPPLIQRLKNNIPYREHMRVTGAHLVLSSLLLLPLCFGTNCLLMLGLLLP